MKFTITNLILLLFLIACYNKGESIEKHLGNIYYYEGKRKLGEDKTEYYTNYYYVKMDGKKLVYIGLDWKEELSFSDYFRDIYYSYDSNNTYVFQTMIETEEPPDKSFLLFKNKKLIFTESFYNSKPTETYKLLNKNHEYYSLAKDYEEKYGEPYKAEDFINGKEPYQKRRNDILNPVKHSYKELENDFKDYTITNLNYIINGYTPDDKFAVLNEDDKELTIACEIKDIKSIVPRLCDPDSYDESEGDYYPTERKRVISMNFDRKYAYIRFSKIDKQRLLSVDKCPVCGKGSYEVDSFEYNPYMKQYECSDCYRDYYFEMRNY